MENIEVESDTEYEVETSLNDIVNSVSEAIGRHSVPKDEVRAENEIESSVGATATLSDHEVSDHEESAMELPKLKRKRRVTQKRLDSLEMARGKRKEVYAKKKDSDNLVKKFADLDINLETLLEKLNEKRELERLEEEQYELELKQKIEKCPVQRENWNSDARYLPRASTNPFASQRYTRN